MIDGVFLPVILSVLLLGFLLWKEFTRQNKTWLIGRITATLLSILSLLALALNLTWRQTITVDSGRDAILLTKGFNEDSVDYFINQHNRPITVYVPDQTMVTAEKYHPLLLTNPDSLVAAGINTLHIYGYGLEESQWKRFNQQSCEFHPTAVSGITAIHWPAELKQGERCYIQGSVNNLSETPVKLVLSGFQTTLDSLLIPANNIQSFQLSTLPRHAGRSVYSLSLISKKDTIETGVIPIQVTEAGRVKILLLASSPDFENKFLKNWLAEKGYEVVTRTTISKNKFQKQYLNTAAINVDRINGSLLEKFDVIIADAPALADLSKQELFTLQSFIAQKKKGLIIRADISSSRGKFYSSPFPLLQHPTNQPQPVDLRFTDTIYKVPALNISSPLTVSLQPGTQPLITDIHERIFVSSTIYGAGKLVITTIPNSFNWALSGNLESYEELWAQLLNSASSVKESEESWSTSPQLPRINDRVTVSLQTNNPALPQGEVEGATIYLENHPALPFSWSGNFWPLKEGWQRGIQLNGDVFYWYVYGDDHWKNVQAFNRVAFTKKQLHKKAAEKITSGTTSQQHVPIPRIYFFLVFLLCNAFIWFENKYHHS